MRLGALTGVLAFGLAGARVASAASGVQVVVGDTCADVDRAQLGRLLNVEQRRETDSGVERARVSVACEGDVVTLRVEQRDEQSLPRVRTFSAADVAGEVGARVLSLAAIELLKPEPEPEPPTEPERPPAMTPPRDVPVAPRVAAPSVRLMAFGTVRSFGFEHALSGGGLSVDYVRIAKLGVRLDFDVAVADRSYEFGSARLQLTTMSAQAGYLALYDAWTARAFVGYRLGAGRISGKAAAGALVPVGTVAGACGGPLVSAGLGFRSGGWVAELGAEAGLVSFPLEGTVADHDPIGLNHYWLGLSLNVGALL